MSHCVSGQRRDGDKSQSPDLRLLAHRFNPGTAETTPSYSQEQKCDFHKTRERAKGDKYIAWDRYEMVKQDMLVIQITLWCVILRALSVLFTQTSDLRPGMITNRMVAN